MGFLLLYDIEELLISKQVVGVECFEKWGKGLCFQLFRGGGKDFMRISTSLTPKSSPLLPPQNPSYSTLPFSLIWVFLEMGFPQVECVTKWGLSNEVCVDLLYLIFSQLLSQMSTYMMHPSGGYTHSWIKYLHSWIEWKSMDEAPNW